VKGLGGSSTLKLLKGDSHAQFYCCPEEEGGGVVVLQSWAGGGGGVRAYVYLT